MYLLDTDILSNLMKREPSTILRRKIECVEVAEQFTSSINLGEMAFGARKKGSEKMLRKVRQIVEHLVVLPFDAAAAEVYGDIRAKLENNGRLIGEADIRIASIALEHGLTVVTANIKHFVQVEGLQVENWLKP